MNDNSEKRFFRNQTSFYEQAIYYYIQRFFPEAINRCVFDGDIEADIYVPTVHCVIEYDGKFWHEEKISRDNFKIHYFNDNGIEVIRVRDSGLPDLEPFEGITLYHKSASSNKKTYHIDEIIEQVIHYLSLRVEDRNKKKVLEEYKLSHEQFLNDCPDINGRLFTEPIDDSLATIKGIEAWDYEKNGSLKPENITLNYSQKVFFKCQSGKSQYVEPYTWLSGSRNDEQDFRRFCPHLNYCKYNCQFKDDFILDYLSGSVQIKEESKVSIRCMLCDSSSTRTALKNRFDSPNDSVLTKRFDELFVIDKTVPDFLGRNQTWLSSSEDTALIKELYINYPGIIVRVDAGPFDKSQEQMNAFVDYYQWVIDLSTRDQKRYYAIGMSFFNSIRDCMIEKKLSKEFAILLLDFIKRNPDEFRYDGHNIEQLSQYTKN